MAIKNPNLSQFDLNLLVAFNTLMTERGVTRAGRVLGITQAAMSNTLRRLRDTFGDPLFIKSGLRMEPTARALELAEPISRALYHTKRVLDQECFDPVNAQHTFRLGVIDCVASAFLPKLMVQLANNAPGITIEMVDVGSHEQAVLLEQGGVDLSVAWFQWVAGGELLMQRLFQMEYACLSRPGNPMVGDTLTLEGFLKARHIQYYPRGLETTPVDESLFQMGHTRTIVTKFFSPSTVPYLVSNSDMLAVIPNPFADFLAKPLGLRVDSIPFKTAPLHIAMAWHPRSKNNPADTWFRAQVYAFFQDEIKADGL